MNMTIRRAEKHVNITAVFECLILNIITAAGVFASTCFIARNAYVAIFYTFVSWSVTISISGGYWIWYLFKKVNADKKQKTLISCFLLVMIATALIIVWWTVNIMF